MAAYGRGLSQRPQIVALNKIDALSSADQAAIAADLETVSHGPVFRVSAVSREGLDALTQQVWTTLDQLKAATPANPTQVNGVQGNLEVSTGNDQ